MSTNEPAHFAGLPNWAKIAIVFAALLLGALSIGFAGKDASDANKNLAFGQKDVEAISAVAKLGHTGPGNDQALVVHTLNVIVHLKAITNYQALGGLAIGAGSAFLAIGFALFLLGADGAFQIQFAGRGDNKLAFYASAPGLLCFLLSAILIAAGAMRKHEIRLGDFKSTGENVNLQQETLGNADQFEFLKDKSKATPQSAPASIEGVPPPSLTRAVKQAHGTLLTSVYVCIDRYTVRDQPHYTINPTQSVSSVGGGASRAVFLFKKMWINGSKLRVSFLDGDPALHAKVKKYAEQWTQYANISFQFGSYTDAEIRVSFKGPGLWSFIGTDAQQVQKDSPTMNLGGITNETNDIDIRSLVLHEFGHVLGLTHEFDPPEGAIQWDREFIYRFFAQPPNLWSHGETDIHFFDKYSIAQINRTSFDPKSIMVMAVPKEFTLNGFQIQWNSDLSDDDKTFIASKDAYPRPRK